MKYTIGHQDFRKIREDGLHYVDKTEGLCQIAGRGGYQFLSRPRRFGKSLTVSTLHELYSGSAELFEGLWAGAHWGFAERRRPVIWLKFARSGFHFAGLSAAVTMMLREQGERLGVELPGGGNLARQFTTLIEGAAATHPSGRVVVLVDEYDKPIIQYLGDTERSEANRELLRGFYSVLKDADPYIELVFITGVSAFSKVSLFSDLNNLQNLTLHPDAYTLLGITQAELERDFGPQLDATRHSREEVRRWYNGYAWGEHETVYNPWSILQYLQTGQLRNFWADSGTPAFVTGMLARDAEYRVAPVKASETDLTSFNLANLNPIAILFQGGYLTVKRDLDPTHRYLLDYPNEEVRRTFLEALLGDYGFGKSGSPTVRVGRLYDAFETRDLPTVVDVVNASLAAVPYQLWERKSEAMAHAIVHTTFSVLGLYTRSEVSTARGRADIVVEVADYVYVIEFKIGGTVAEALAQIGERGYAAAYADDAREVVRVGMVFDPETRSVNDWAEG